jgi:hypothetical protein
MLLALAQWIQATPFFTYLRQSAYTYPCVLSLHMVAIALFGGMILITDLRLLGWSMRRRPISDIVNQLRKPKRFGLLLAVTCGLMMFGAKAEEYYYNPFFRAKLALFALIAIHALFFRTSVYRNVAEMDLAKRVPGYAKLAASLSLLLWTGVVCMGRGIGYVEPPWVIQASVPHAKNPRTVESR